MIKQYWNTATYTPDLNKAKVFRRRNDASCSLTQGSYASGKERINFEVKEVEIKLQAEKLAKLEAQKKAEQAPDREKLVAYAVELGC